MLSKHSGAATLFLVFKNKKQFIIIIIKRQPFINFYFIFIFSSEVIIKNFGYSKWRICATFS